MNPSLLTGLTALARFLLDEPRLLGLMEAGDADATKGRRKGAAALAQRLSGTAAERIELLQRLVARISVGANSIEIDVRIAAMWLCDRSPIENEAVTTIMVPVQLKRCGLAVRLIVRAPWASKVRAPDPRLVQLLAKAQQWFTSLSSGSADSALVIAQEHGLASRCRSRR